MVKIVPRHAVLNKSSKQHLTKNQLCDHLLPISQIIQKDVLGNIDPIYQPLRSGRIWHKVNF